MTDDSRQENGTEESRIEQEIRRRRGFTVAGALAGRDGGGHLKGASPTPLLRQAALDLAHWLDTHLEDHDGALRAVVLRSVTQRPDLLERHAHDPAGAVAAWLPAVLANRAALAELVRQADVEWGRLYQERPFFEREGAPPHAEDPYTRDDVHRRLTDLLATANG